MVVLSSSSAQSYTAWDPTVFFKFLPVILIWCKKILLTVVLFSGVCESFICTWLGFEHHVKHLFIAKYPFNRKLSLQEVVPEYHASRVTFSRHLSFCFQTWNGIRVKVGHVPNDFLSAVVLRSSVFSCRGKKNDLSCSTQRFSFFLWE